jgi:hypothetical protein
MPVFPGAKRALRSAGNNFRSPLDISGLQAFYKYDTGLTTDGAAQFASASSEYLSRTAQAWGFGNAWSVSLWYKQSAAASSKTIFQFGSNMANSTGRNSAFKMVSDYVYIADSSAAIFKHYQGIPTSTNWTHAVMTWDGTTLKVYSNGSDITGSLTKTMDNAGTMADDSRILQIGAARNATQEEFFDGAVDSFGIWARALSAGDATTLYNSGNGVVYSDLSAGMKTNLISWYDLDEVSGSRADSHGSNTLTDNNTVTSATGIAAGAASDGDPIKQWSDQSGKNLTLTQTTVARKPTYDSALKMVKFLGTDDIIVRSNVSALNFERGTPFTLFANFRPGNTADDMMIMAQEQNSGNFNGWYLIFGGSSGSDTMMLFLQQNATKGGVTRGSTALATGTTYSVVARYDGTTPSEASGIKVWINGVAETMTVVDNDLDGSIASTTADFALGGRSDAGGAPSVPCTGWIGDNGIYNTALTDAQIISLSAWLGSRK